ncbi:MAG: aa3-type cytochrome c oxidase subunit IV [Paracoccaceae bacterium]
MAKHVHGSVDVTGHQKTLSGFIRIVGWSIVVIIAVLVFIAFVNG